MLFLRTFFVLFLFVTFLNAKEYPKIFSSLATPLYQASYQLNSFKSNQNLNTEILHYQKDARHALHHAILLEQDPNQHTTIAYLQELRALQKEYDYTLHLIRQEILKVLSEDDYDSLMHLTSSPLMMLFEKNSFRDRVIDYYATKRLQHTKKSKLLDAFVKEKKVIDATRELFFQAPKSSAFSSHSKHKHRRQDVFATEKRGDDYVDIFFTNSNRYAVTIKVREDFSHINKKSYQDKVFVIKAKSKVKYARLYYTSPLVKYSFAYKWVAGSKDAQHDNNYLYRLPYRVGESHMVSQGFHGKATHKGHAAYAVDFQMKVGTKIYAARDGIVFRLKENSNKHGFDKKFSQDGNYVTILHNDGTFGTYYHLKKGGVVVHRWQKITRGELLGYSGNTGYSSGPHLHFAVYKVLDNFHIQSLPIKFISARGVITNPQQGVYYKAR
jgi:murein DD-endopeptidase MepM/ murein hydrolase activator NlpD